MPVAFAQVREDPALDLWVLDQISQRKRVALVASGGCTAAALAARTDVDLLHLVDPNPAQIALARLKLLLLETTEPADRLRLLGHAHLDTEIRATRLTELLGQIGLPSNIFGSLDLAAERGPDHSGRYELLFAALREELTSFAQSLEDVLGLSDPKSQALRVRPETRLGQALDTAFAKIMALPNLVALFGEDATRSPREPFAIHFAGRLRTILKSQPAAGNPFLSQMLLGRFSPSSEHYWLRLPTLKPTPTVSWDESPMVPVLKRHQNTFDMVHLSNILDWLTPDNARDTLESARTALRPGGWLIVRQLNSVLDIPALCQGFAWDSDASKALLSRDRSFFYRAICVGKRK